ncbi:MAG TPA: tetratricopeptide repeat protein [Bryobacteraceae bacterium]|nr:tetratricopeptide repeat protein [Bryobacteraceae bacterium]
MALLCLAAPLAAQDAESLAQRAVQSQQAGDFAGAEKAWRGVIQLQPDSVAAHVNLGVVLVNLGHYDEAIAEYEAADRLLPGDPRIALNTALACEKSGRIAEAQRRFEALHRSSPDDLKISMLLADCRLQTGDNAGVIDLLQPVEAREPDNLAVAYLLGMALLKENRVAEGQQLLDRILRNADSAEARFLLGVRMFAAGDYPAAVKQLVSAIELNPKLPGLQSLYGQALLNTGDPDAALAAFRKELANNPNDFGANLGLGQILTARKQFGEAVPALERALLVRPQSAEAKQWLANARQGKPVKEARADAGPRVKDLAPDFELPDANTGQKVRLSAFRGRSAVVLIFGSYSCPNFRGSAETLKALQRRFGRQIPFLLVYIREAHASNQWQSTRNERENVALSPAATLGQKRDYAQMCSRKLHLDFPAVVDGMDGAVESAYQAWPSRVFVIGKDGWILYGTRLTELDFRPEEMTQVLAAASK